MTTGFDAGTSVGKYFLQADQAEQTQKRLIQNYINLEASLQRARAKAAQPFPAATAPTPKATTPTSGPSPAAQAADQAKIAAAIERRAGIEARLVQVQNTGKQALTGLTQAERIYSDALAKVAKDSDSALRLQTQLASVQNRIKNIGGGGGPALPRTLESFGTEAIDQFKSGLLGIVGPAAVATAALAALKGAADLTVEGENINRVGRSFESLAKQAGTSGDAILGALRKASGGEISDLNIELAADKGLLLGVANTAQDFAAIMEIARDRAAKMGITTTQAFDDITTGIGRESPRILDNLGLIVDEDAAHVKYAQSIGKSVDALTKAERIEALRNAVIAQGRGTLDAQTTAINDQTNSYARLGVAIENAKNRTGSFLSTQTQGTAGGVADLLNGIFNTNSDTASKAAGGAQTLVRAIAGLPPVTKEAQDAQVAWTKSVFDWIEAREKQIGLFSANTGGGGTFDFAPDPAIAELAIAQAKRIGGAFDEDRQAVGRLQEALGTSNSELQKSADASALDAAKKDLQQAATNKVAFETDAAASAFIRLNPNLDASQAFAAAAAQGLGPLVAQVIALRIEADKTRAALLGEKLNAQTARELVGAGSDRADIAAGKHAGAVAGRARGQAEAQASAEALRQARAAQGDVGPSLAHAQAVLNQLTRDGKQGTAEYIKAQDAVRTLQAQQQAQGQKLIDDQIAYADAVGNTAKQRKLLNDELAKAKAAGDLGEQARILKQIDALNKEGERAGRSAATAAEKQLSLEERIRDAKEAQLKASLDAQKSAARDVLDRLKEQQELKKAFNILANPNARTDFKQAAQARIDIINADRQLRQIDIAQKQATAGGTIVNGRVLQSVQAGAPVLATPITANRPQQQTQIAPSVPAGVGTPIQFLVDGKVVAEVIVPFVVADLHGGLRTAQSAGAGAG